MDTIKLRNDVAIPQIGLGTWKLTDRREVLNIITAAAKCGYRLIDTAAAYGNEIAIGKALRETTISREHFFIQDKLWNTCYGYEKTQEACKRSLKKLKLDYFDAYLIHWPASPKLYENWVEVNSETWRGMERLYEDGLVRAIGVCNFKEHHLTRLLETALVVPHINQIEFHPGLMQRETVMFCKKNKIQLEASSPLGSGQLLEDHRLCELAEKKEISTAQLCLRWAAEHGFIVIPKTGNEKRLIENRQIWNFPLTNEDMQKIDELPFIGGLALDSDEVTGFEGL